jgi:hypothetical protein
VTCRLKARTVGPEETAVARERLGKHASSVTDTHAAIEELLKAVFYMRSVPRPGTEPNSESESGVVVRPSPPGGGMGVPIVGGRCVATPCEDSSGTTSSEPVDN